MKLFDIIPANQVIFRLGAILTLTGLFALLLPLDGLDVRSFLPLHTALDTASMVIAVFIFSSSFYRLRNDTSVNQVFLSNVFLIVALLDFTHMLSYAGMLDFAGGGQEKTEDFWLTAQLFAALSLFAATLRFGNIELSRRRQNLFMATALIFALILCWAIIRFNPTLPALLDENGRYTTFKRTFEYAIAGLYIYSATVFLRHKAHSCAYDAGLMFASAAVLGIGEVLMATDDTFLDKASLLGHIYKVIGYYLLYQAILDHHIRLPFRQLAASEQRLRTSEGRYRLIVETASEGIWLIDRRSAILYANTALAKMLGLEDGGQLAGRNLFDFISEPDGVAAGLARLHHGKTEHLEVKLRRCDGAGHYAVLAVSPVFEDGEYVGALLMVTDIDKRHRADKLIAELYNRATNGFHSLDPDGMIVDINDTELGWLGYSRDEVVGRMSIKHLLTEEGFQTFLAYLPVLKTLGQFTNLNFEMVRKDGSTFPVLISATAITDDAGTYRKCRSVVLDMTERYAAQIKQRKSEERLLMLYNSIHDALYVLPFSLGGAPGKFMDVNENACRMLGYSRQELLARSIADIDDAHEGVSPAPYLERLFAGEKVCFEQIHVARNGRHIPVEITANAFILDGQPVIMALARDISERKRMETALRENEELFRNIFERAETGIVLSTPEGAFIRANPKFCRIVGYTEAELRGMTFRGITHPDDQEQEVTALRQLSQGAINHFTMDRRHIRKDGSLAWVNLTASAIRNDDGGINYLIWAVEDVTKRKQAKQQLRELSAHIQTVREEEKALIAREIHDELGGTLTALKIDLYWVSRKMPPVPEIEPLLERMESMSQLLDSAVGVTRRIITELRPTLLDDMGLLAALEWQASQFQKRTGIPCRVKCGEDRGSLDRQHSITLFRIFQETLTNISRHANASQVDVLFHHNEHAVKLAVQDNGCGMGDKTPAKNRYGIRGILERAASLGGVAHIYSQPGKGVTVTIILPLDNLNYVKDDDREFPD